MQVPELPLTRRATLNEVFRCTKSRFPGLSHKEAPGASGFQENKETGVGEDVEKSEPFRLCFAGDVKWGQPLWETVCLVFSKKT